MSDKVAIEVRNVKKDFFLPHHKSGSIKEGIVQVFRKKKRVVRPITLLRVFHSTLKMVNFSVL